MNPEYLFVHSHQLDGDGYPRDCPFDTRRAGMTLERCEQMGLLSGTDRAVREAEALNEMVLLRFHTPGLLAALKRGQEGVHDRDALERGLGTPDCPLFPGMYDFVRLAAGGSVTGARAILNDGARVAFNPSGGFHHAFPDRAAGFCYLNDVVLAVMELTDARKRVLVLDIDAHHGDGVQAAFYARADVMTISLHESGKTLFPGTGFETEVGEGAGVGYSVNIPLPVGAYDAIYELAFRDVVMPLIKAYAPDVLVLELGMDALAGDPLAHLNLTNNTHADLLDRLLRLKIPILATGGGGYHVENTVRGWTLCWSVLCGEHALQEQLMAGMGGVMLENTDWLGGLRDRRLLSDAGNRNTIDSEVERVCEYVRRHVFPVHGI